MMLGIALADRLINPTAHPVGGSSATLKLSRNGVQGIETIYGGPLCSASRPISEIRNEGPIRVQSAVARVP